MSNLKNNQLVFIKPCDKGGYTYIKNTRDYLTKIHTNQHNHNTYKPLTHNATSAIANDAYTLIEYIHSQDIIGKATTEFLLPNTIFFTPKNTRTLLYYGFLPTQNLSTYLSSTQNS